MMSERAYSWIAPEYGPLYDDFSPERLAPSLRASAFTNSPRGALVEGLEEPGERFVLGVQCHPERTESSPADLERVWAAFIEAARPR